jgi:hypothetical protein
MKHKHPKLRLMPLQTRIMWALEEDEESLPTLANSLRYYSTAAHDMDYLEELGASLHELVRLQLLDYSPQSAQGFTCYLPLKEVLKWQGEHKSWLWNERVGGTEALRLFLTQKGYKGLSA